MISPDETTDTTPSHLTKPLKRQVIGYSHSTDEATSHPTVGTTSHSTRLPKGGSQVASYKQPQDCCQVVGYKRGETCVKYTRKEYAVVVRG
jgi:hypothetical protein